MPDFTLIAGHGGAHLTDTRPCAWDGGDPSDVYNSISGSYGAYSYFKRYTTPGAYTITKSPINGDAPATYSVLVNADTRPVTAAPIDTWMNLRYFIEHSAANRVITVPRDIELLQTAAEPSPGKGAAISILASGITLRAVGSGVPTTITRTPGSTGPGMFSVHANDFQLEGFHLQSNLPFSSHPSKVNVYGVEPYDCTGLTLVDCQCNDIDCVYNGSAKYGVNVALVRVICDATMRGVNAWPTGNCNAFLGCAFFGNVEASVRNSTDGLLYVLMYDCDVTGPDYIKETISPREGGYWSILKNRLTNGRYTPQPCIRVGDVPPGPPNVPVLIPKQPYQGWDNMIVSDNEIRCPSAWAMVINGGATNITFGKNKIYLSVQTSPVVITDSCPATSSVNGPYDHDAQTTGIRLLDNITYLDPGINLSGSTRQNIYKDNGPKFLTSADLTVSGNTVGNPSASVLRIAFTRQPTPIVSGQPVTPPVQVSVQSSAGAVQTANTSLITITSASPGFVTRSVAAVNGVATFTGLTVSAVGSCILFADGDGFSRAASNAFAVTAVVTTPTPVLAFTVQPTDITSGQPITPSVQVTIQDSTGATLTANTSPITISCDTAAVSGTLTVTPANGVATFAGLSINGSGSCILKAAAAGLPDAHSHPFLVLAVVVAPPQPKLVFSVQPTSIIVGAAISPTVVVRIADPGTNATLVSDAASITLSASGATFSGAVTVTAVNGQAMFTGLSLTNPGTYVLTASAAGHVSAVSNTIVVSPAVADTTPKLAFSVQPADATAGNLLGPITVQIDSSTGTLLSSDTSLVTLTPVPATPLIGTPAIAAAGGVATFENLMIDEPGTYHFQASVVGYLSASSNLFSINADQSVVITSNPLSGADLALQEINAGGGQFDPSTMSLRALGVLAATILSDQVQGLNPDGARCVIVISDRVTGNLIAGAQVWVTSDPAGIVLYQGAVLTDTLGQAVFNLVPGETYYLSMTKPGETPIVCQPFTAVAN